MIKIWKNTATLDDYGESLNFTNNKKEANIALLGSKPIQLMGISLIESHFGAGIGKDNVPEVEAEKGNNS